jgi:hypothetical protein
MWNYSFIYSLMNVYVIIICTYFSQPYINIFTIFANYIYTVLNFSNSTRGNFVILETS